MENFDRKLKGHIEIFFKLKCLHLKPANNSLVRNLWFIFCDGQKRNSNLIVESGREETKRFFAQNVRSQRKCFEKEIRLQWRTSSESLAEALSLC